MSSVKPLNPPQPLTKEHDCSDFDCGSEELNFFLRRLALKNQRKNSSRTCVTTRGNRGGRL